jgi:peptide/nickel transport system permease protein
LNQKSSRTVAVQHPQRFREITVSLRLLRRNPISIAGIGVIAFFVLIAIAAPYIAPYPGQGEGAANVEARLLAPSTEHWFGTDELGRDLLSRVIFGSRLSLLTSVSVVGAAVAIGMPLGAVGGYRGGKIGAIIMRTTDMFLAFPPLLLALAITASLGGNLINAVLALIITWWPWYTRLAYGQALTTKNLPYIDSARAIGVGDSVIIVRHILPATVAPVLVQATLDLGGAILSVAGLSFLGLGAQPPTPDWGLFVSMGKTYFLNHWWYATFPGLCIMTLVVGFNLLGDAIRDVVDPKLSRRRLV